MVQFDEIYGVRGSTDAYKFGTSVTLWKWYCISRKVSYLPFVIPSDFS